MLLTRYEPFGLFGHFGNEMNRMLAGNRSEGKTAVERDWTPAVDIREEDNRFVLEADIPGWAAKWITTSNCCPKSLPRSVVRRSRVCTTIPLASRSAWLRFLRSTE